MKEFAELYKTAKTWADADRAIDALSFDDLCKLSDCMEIVKDTTGLDMRQEFYLGIMKSRIKFHEAQIASV